MLKLVNNLFLSRSGSNSLRVQVSLFVFFVCYIDSVKPLKIKKNSLNDYWLLRKKVQYS